MPAEVIDLQRFKLVRRAGQADSADAVLPWSAQHWPMCRIRYFVRNTTSGRPPRCCCGRVYNRVTLQARAPVITAIVRETVQRLTGEGLMTMARLAAALQVHPELTSVERAALNTGPCATCPVLSEQAEQLRFLWGLYRAYWGRAVQASVPRRHHNELRGDQARQSAIDLRRHIRHEIALIRHLQQQLALCPWARRRPMSRSSNGSPGY
ncbi:MAG: hypothetical protein HY699_00730 [Deltaproteobacteria bacterium]|nr:hypothetical protein [Deltaproteobacteria bacterium]